MAVQHLRQPLASSHIKPYHYTTTSMKLQYFFHSDFVDFLMFLFDIFVFYKQFLSFFLKCGAFPPRFLPYFYHRKSFFLSEIRTDAFYSVHFAQKSSRGISISDSSHFMMLSHSFKGTSRDAPHPPAQF